MNYFLRMTFEKGGGGVKNVERFAELVYREALLFDLLPSRRQWSELTEADREDWTAVMARAVGRLVLREVEDREAAA